MNELLLCAFFADCSCSHPEDVMWYCGSRAQQRGLDSGINEQQRRQWWRKGAVDGVKPCSSSPQAYG
jgi:hypothetical protein